MQLNLGTILAASAEARPDHPAILFGERRVRFSELDRQARGVAGALRERGIGPGEKVAILVPNLPEFSVGYFGILYADSSTFSGTTVQPA